MADFKVYNDIWDSLGRRIGRIYNREIQDSAGRRIGQICDQDIQDSSGRRIGKVYNRNIQDASGCKIATINEARKQIDGTNTMDPVYVAALWLCFVKRGVFSPPPLTRSGAPSLRMSRKVLDLSGERD